MKESEVQGCEGAQAWGEDWDESHELFTDVAQVQAHRRAILQGPRPSAWASNVLIHWTGFEPFGAHAVNPSWAVAQAAHEALGQHPRLTSRRTCLPVTYACARTWHSEAVADVAPDPQCPRVWVHVGLAADRPEVCFERSAYGAAGPTPDNEGCVGQRSGVFEAGAELLRTALDVEAMCAQWDTLEVEVRATASDDPGRYVCNAVYYHALGEVQRARRRGRAGAALFVHVPRLDARASRRVGRALARVVVGALPAVRIDMG